MVRTGIHDAGAGGEGTLQGDIVGECSWFVCDWVGVVFCEVCVQQMLLKDMS